MCVCVLVLAIILGIELLDTDIHFFFFFMDRFPLNTFHKNLTVGFMNIPVGVCKNKCESRTKLYQFL